MTKEASLKPAVSWRDRVYQYRHVIFLVCAVAAAFWLRYVFLGHETWDLVGMNKSWLEAVRDHGLPGIKKHIDEGADLGHMYPPMVFYMFYLASLLPVGNVILQLKSIGYMADAIGAFFAYRLVFALTASKDRAALAAVLLLFAPTVLMNGAMWGQTDMYYAAPLLGMLYFLVVGKRRANAASICLAVSLLFKIQAIYLLPLLLLLFVTNHYPLRYLLWIPALTAAAGLPAFLAGAPASFCFFQYGNLMRGSSGINYGTPNLYPLLNTSRIEGAMNGGGILLAIAGVGILAYLALCRKRPLTAREILRAALALAVVCPFFLPHMHERYFFAADMIALVLCVITPRRYVGALLAITAASSIAMTETLLGSYSFDLKYASVLMVLALIWIYRDFALRQDDDAPVVYSASSPL